MSAIPFAILIPTRASLLFYTITFPINVTLLQ